MQTKFSRSLKRNQETFRDLLKLDTSDDIAMREFTALGLDCALFFVQGMCGSQQISDNVLRPMQKSKEEAFGHAALELAMKKLLEAAEIQAEKNISMAIEQMMQGQCLLLMDSVDQAIIMDLRQYVRRGITTPQTESVVVGPQEAFNEVMRDNLTLLHRRIQSPDFVTEILKVGTQVSTQVALCYINGVCKQATVEEMKRRIGGIAVDYVLTSGSLEQLIEDDPYAPLPQVAATERPDRVVSFLMEGQAVLLIDGSPRAIAMPMGFWHLFHAPDDTYMRWYYGLFTRFIRLFGSMVSLLLPAVFVALVVFHPTTIPMTLLTSIMESRSVVPLSLFGEALLMITIFNLINEAGVRVPGIMGSSLGLVSALILGTAAVQAGLVSPLLIIVVALSGLGSYALPNYSLSFAFRLEQMLLLVAGGIMGLTGVCLMGVLLLCQIAGMESLGQPYLAPSSPQRQHNPDLLTRTPLFRQRLRGYLSNPSNMKRATGRMRRFEEGDQKKP